MASGSIAADELEQAIRDVQRLVVPQLKQANRSHGLAVSGTKAVLQERIRRSKVCPMP